jgi:hypothetical protein
VVGATGEGLDPDLFLAALLSVVVPGQRVRTSRDAFDNLLYPLLRWTSDSQIDTPGDLSAGALLVSGTFAYDVCVRRSDRTEEEL